MQCGVSGRSHFSIVASGRRQYDIGFIGRTAFRQDRQGIHLTCRQTVLNRCSGQIGHHFSFGRKQAIAGCLTHGIGRLAIAHHSCDRSRSFGSPHPGSGPHGSGTHFRISIADVGENSRQGRLRILKPQISDNVGFHLGLGLFQLFDQSIVNRFSEIGLNKAQGGIAVRAVGVFERLEQLRHGRLSFALYLCI